MAQDRSEVSVYPLLPTLFHGFHWLTRPTAGSPAGWAEVTIKFKQLNQVVPVVSRIRAEKARSPTSSAM